MVRTILLVTIGLLLLGMAGCGSPEYVEHSMDDVCSSAVNNDLIRVTGVLKPIENVLEREQRYRVLLVKGLGQDQPAVGLWIRKGNAKNRMRPIADGLKFDDVQVQTADGRMVAGGDTITVSGRFSPVCELKVDRIE